MAIGETLLKITDYPFTYSLTVILLRTGDIDLFSKDALIFLAIAGFAGTLLALLDPFGRVHTAYTLGMQKDVFKYYSQPDLETKFSFKILSKIRPKLKIRPKISRKWEDIESAYHTKAIEVERDKIVSSIYFLILIIATLLIVYYTDIIENNYPPDLKNQYCDIGCVNEVVIGSLFVISIIVAGIIAWNGSNIYPKARTVSTYLLAINSTFVTKTSIDTLSRYIESGDWKTAEYWNNIVENEYVNEEGLKETRQNSLHSHISQILGMFQRHKEDADNTNTSALADLSDLSNPTKKYRGPHEIIQSFNLYQNLIEHLYTNSDQELFNTFHDFIVISKKIQKNSDKWEKEKQDGINTIIKKLKIDPNTEHENGIQHSSSRQWVNKAIIRRDLDTFLTYSRTELLPIRGLSEGSPLFLVRFFDSSTLPNPRDDRVAALYKEDAETLTVELGTLVTRLNESINFSQTDYENQNKLYDKLKSKLNEMILSYSIGGNPLDGSCFLCQNEKFFDKATIEKHQEKLDKFPKNDLEPLKKISRWQDMDSNSPIR